MPVHAVAGGYRWGSTGKVYKSKAAAERQARAIYASGWREDSRRLHAIALHDRGHRGRFARRRLAKMMQASARAERGYVRDLVRAFQGFHRAMLAHVERRLPAPQMRQDDDDDPIADTFLETLLVWLVDRARRAFGVMAALVEKKNARTHDLLGITPRSIGLEELVDAARDANIGLVERAGRRYAADVRAIIGDASRFAERPESLRDALVERGNVSVSRAMLIGRDQTLKLNAQIARARHEAVGVAEYRWSGVLDERERPMHRDLEGERHAYDDPPVTAPNGDRNNPGEDYQCRCVAIPFIPELEEPPAEALDVAAE